MMSQAFHPSVELGDSVDWRNAGKVFPVSAYKRTTLHVPYHLWLDHLSKTMHGNGPGEPPGHYHDRAYGRMFEVKNAATANPYGDSRLKWRKMTLSTCSLVRVCTMAWRGH